MKTNKRKTTQEFIQKAKDVHGNKYDYSKVEYTNNREKVVIICEKHGEFYVSPKSHLNGVNCKQCAYELNSKNRTWDTEKFLQKARSVHGDKYDYSKTVVTKADRKCTVICLKHGDFEIKPTTHGLGVGCPWCAAEYRADLNRVCLEECLRRFREKHGNRYDYSKVIYSRRSDNVTITCEEHGDFQQSPGSHLAGSGCPKCAEYSYRQDYWTTHPTTNLYLLKLRFSGFAVLKLGISKDIQARLKTLKADLVDEANVQMEVIKEVSGNSKLICEYEKSIHEGDRYSKIFVGRRFGGYTECYPIRYESELIGDIEIFAETLRVDCNNK